MRLENLEVVSALKEKRGVLFDAAAAAMNGTFVGKTEVQSKETKFFLLDFVDVQDVRSAVMAFCHSKIKEIDAKLRALGVEP